MQWKYAAYECGISVRNSWMLTPSKTRLSSTRMFSTKRVNNSTRTIPSAKCVDSVTESAGYAISVSKRPRRTIQSAGRSFMPREYRTHPFVYASNETSTKLPRYFSHRDSVFAETSFPRRDNAIRDAIRPLTNTSLSQRIRYLSASGETTMHRDIDLKKLKRYVMNFEKS